VCLIESARDIARFTDGAILVTGTTDPDWVPIMKRAAAIVTDHGGRTSHAAIVSRELGLPAIVGTGNATELLHDEQQVTVSCAEGDEGFVYEGAAEFETEALDLDQYPRDPHQVMLNLANPAAALRWWRLPADGVGLARMEFVVTNHIKVHPMALINYDRLKDAEAKRAIAELTAAMPRQAGILRRPPVARSRPHRRIAVPEAGDRAHERLQDQRVRRSDRRGRVRARGREPDARFPRRLAILLAALPRGLRARVPGHPPAARGHGFQQRRRHDPVLPLAQGSRSGAGGDGRERADARERTASRSMSCARSPPTSFLPRRSRTASTASPSARTT
jgi:phosphoenolpyruvate synthase/pyruvate phosphate dikinase